MQIEIAFVARVDGDGGIAQHGFGARGGDDQIAVRADDRIADVPEVAGGFLVHGFEIGDGGLAARAPVDHVLAAIDQAFFVEADEGFADGAGEAGIEREALARPVAGGAELDHLPLDGAAGFGFPLPDARFEGLAAHGAAVEAFVRASWRSTTICVAMPAWSMPGSHSVMSPRMRCQRTVTSISVCSSMWPMWSDPVTLGGGMTSENTGRSGCHSAR